MATAPDPTELAEQARCLQCGLPPGMEMPVLIYLFCKIANVSPDPTELAEQARCLQCGLPPGIQGSVLIYLANQIANGSGSGVLEGNGVPVTAPSNAASPALYVDLLTGTIWTWNTTTQTWQ